MSTVPKRPGYCICTRCQRFYRVDETITVRLLDRQPPQVRRVCLDCAESWHRELLLVAREVRAALREGAQWPPTIHSA